MRFLATVENRPQAVCGAGVAGCEREIGGRSGRFSPRPVAVESEPGSGSSPVERLSGSARTSLLDRGPIAEPIEPPYTDPYVRWCGRGGGAIRPPIPIKSACATQTL